MIKISQEMQEKYDIFEDTSLTNESKKIERLSGILFYKANAETDPAKSAKLKKLSKALFMIADELKSF